MAESVATPFADKMLNRLAITGFLFASFVSFSLVVSPVPGVNEPHYLSKAKHYWNPDWCQGDLFLDSSDAHVVFYQTLGWLTCWMQLEHVAWVGRAFSMLLLASGWSLFVARILPGRYSSLWVAWIFLLFSSIGNFSGEWLVGGIEAKTIAYGFVFLSLAFCIERRWRLAAICSGLAISFHPIVGIWNILAGGVGGVLALLLNQELRSTLANNGTLSGIGSWCSAAVLLVACSLPGLLPALQLLTDSDQVVFRANYIQVYYRLAHHLDPRRFSEASYCCYSLLIVFWLICVRPARLITLGRGWRVLSWYVAGALVIALVGLAIGLGPVPQQNMQYAFRLSLMKLYPFRLFDVMLPIVVSMAVVALGRSWLDRERRTNPKNLERSIEYRTPASKLTAWILLVSIPITAFALSTFDQPASRMDKAERDDWIAACRWISEKVETGTLFFTPRNSWAFKWYANRAEYVSFKDCPQDARSIVEWNRRQRYLKDWARTNFDHGYSVNSLRKLNEQTGITHLITPFRRLGPFDAELIYRNRTFHVYCIAEQH